VTNIVGGLQQWRLKLLPKTAQRPAARQSLTVIPKANQSKAAVEPPATSPGLARPMPAGVSPAVLETSTSLPMRETNRFRVTVYAHW
jgi:hypothetical protein